MLRKNWLPKTHQWAPARAGKSGLGVYGLARQHVWWVGADRRRSQAGPLHADTLGRKELCGREEYCCLWELVSSRSGGSQNWYLLKHTQVLLKQNRELGSLWR